MAKRALRTVTVPRGVTLLLLILFSVGIALLTLWASGKAYSKVDPVPFRDIRVLAEKLSEGPLPMSTVVALIMPTLLNVLFFMPWGFLAFILLDHGERPALNSYLLTFFSALAFSGAIEAWQYFLPTRVTDINDVIANGLGAVVGAFFGHLRKRVRVAFE